MDAACSKTDATTIGGAEGTASVIATGGTAPYTYLWSNGQTTASISGLTAGTYSVTVTDANGATSTASYTVPNQIPNNFSTSVGYAANCTGQLTITSPLVLEHTRIYVTGVANVLDYVFPATTTAYSQTITNLAPGTYTLHIVPSVESSYCADTEIEFHIGATISPTIIGECVTALNANAGGTNYAWSTGQTTQSIAPTSIGTYTVTVTNATGCSTATYTLTGGNAVACCQAGLTYTINTPTYTATSGTWANGSNPFGNATAALNLNTNFIVPNGVTLTINNLNLNFSGTSKITIQKGGRLNLNGCVLDGVCSGMCLGIQVQCNGLSVTPPPPLPIGYIYPGGLFSNNNTEIRNAVIGVVNTLLPNLTIDNIATYLTNTTDTQPGFITGYSLSSVAFSSTLWTDDAIAKAGGVVNAQNTTFTNCFQGINLSWRGHKLNKIDHCTFNSPQTGGLLYPFNAPNTRTEAGIALMGSAIDEIHTAWTLSTVSNCVFNRTKFGVRSNFINTLTVRDCSFNSNKVGTSVAQFLEDTNLGISIRQNTYDQCVMAIQASGLDNLSIRDNHINENYNTPFNSDPLAQRKVGIYARGCNPIVRNNSIGGTEYGIILTDTEADGSLLAGNVLNHTGGAITAEGNNTGITARCNHLINRFSTGITIRKWATNAEPGDLGIQGKCDENQPAAFTFTTQAGYNPIAIYLNDHTNPFTLEDVGANLLSNSSNPDAGGSYSGVGCNLPDFSLDQYCSGQGYTSIDDIANLIGSGGITDKALSELLVKYLDAEDYTAALQLIYNYQNSLVMQRRLVPQNIVADSTTKAQQVLQQLPDNTEETYQYKRFYTLLNNLKTTHRNLINITPAEQSLLTDIANSRTKTAFKAQTCLYVARGIEFPVLLPTDAGDYTVFKNDETTALQDKVSLAIPNPTANETSFNYQLETNETAKLSVFDLNGRLLQQAAWAGSGTYVLNTSQMSTGMYIYTISINGTEQTRAKLTIIK